MFRKLFLAFIIIFQFSNIINSEVIACNRYPYKSGLKISKKRKKLIIKSTSQVNVFLHDVDEIQDAYLEAENVAITNIAKYLQTKVNLNQNNNQIKKSSKNDSKEDQKETSLTNNYDLESQEYLSGINIINKCYEKNDYVRVTVILDQTKLNEVKNLKSDLIKSILNTD